MSNPHSGNSLLVDEPPYLSSMQKWKIFSDWSEFIGSGFQFQKFSADLYQYLVQYCGLGRGCQNQMAFWVHYFDSEVDKLRLFLHQFGTGVGAETGTSTWLSSPTQDLKNLMMQRLGLVYMALLQSLEDLEFRHDEMIQAWASFATQNGISLTNVRAPGYRASVNTRDMLAFSGRIALLYSQQQPEPTDIALFGYYQLASPLVQPMVSPSPSLSLVPLG